MRDSYLKASEGNPLIDLHFFFIVALKTNSPEIEPSSHDDIPETRQKSILAEEDRRNGYYR